MNIMMKRLNQKFDHIVISTKIILLLSMSLACTGCSVFEFLKGYEDEHTEYERLRDEKIGKESSISLERYQLGLLKGDYIIVDYQGIKVYQEKDRDLSTYPNLSYRDFFGCKTDYYVDVETGIIFGWRYVRGSEPFRCTHNRYEGSGY